MNCTDAYKQTESNRGQQAATDVGVGHVARQKRIAERRMRTDAVTETGRVRASSGRVGKPTRFDAPSLSALTRSHLSCLRTIAF